MSAFRSFLFVHNASLWRSCWKVPRENVQHFLRFFFGEADVEARLVPTASCTPLANNCQVTLAAYFQRLSELDSGVAYETQIKRPAID
jgi:hypothetical protein